MMFFAKPLIAGLFTTLMFFSVCPAQANSWRHLQDLGLDIQINSDRLMGETHRYVHTAHYQQMLRAVRNMRAKAVRIHVLAIQRGCLFEMERELRHLDRNFHRVEDLFQHIHLHFLELLLFETYLKVLQLSLGCQGLMN